VCVCVCVSVCVSCWPLSDGAMVCVNMFTCVNIFMNVKNVFSTCKHVSCTKDLYIFLNETYKRDIFCLFRGILPASDDIEVREICQKRKRRG